MRSRWLSRVALLVSAALVASGLAASPAQAAEWNDWTVTAGSTGLTLVATDAERASFDLDGYNGCVTWRDRVNNETVFKQTCGIWYATYEGVFDRGTKPTESNCIASISNSSTYCQRMSGFSVTANDKENWLFLNNAQGIGGYAVNVDLKAGNDLVDVSGPGSWTFEGGPGIDRFSPSRPYTADGSRVWEQYTIDLGTGIVTPAAFEGGPLISDPVTLTGFEDVTLSGNGIDNVTGTDEDNWLSVAGGNDVVNGKDGRDRIEGGDGDDYLDGGPGNDSIFGWLGNDTIKGGYGDDFIYETQGGEIVSDDIIDAGPGDDRINASGGDDTITGGPGADIINCGAGEDTVTDAEPADTINEDCEHVSAGLEVELTPYDPDGTEIDGLINPGQEVIIEAEITNNTGDDLDSFDFDGGEVMFIDERSTGGIAIVDQSDDISPTGLTMADGESIAVTYTITATQRGLAAANSKVTALDPDDEEQVGYKSLRIDIEDGSVVDDAIGQWVMLQTLDRYLMKMYNEWMDAMDKRGKKLRNAMAKYLSKAERALYFGAEKGLEVSGFEALQGLLRSTSPKVTAAHLPNEPIGGYTVDQLNSEYNDAFLDEVGKGVADWANNWKNVGKKAKGAAKDAYGEALLATMWALGNATPEERMEFEAKMINFADNNTTSKKNLINGIKREIPKWKENGTYMWEALEKSAKDVTLQSPDLKAQLKQEATWRKNTLKLADTDPVRFQREWAKRDAEIANLGIPLIFDTLIGGGLQKVGAVKVTGRGTSVISAGESMGVLKANGKAVKGPKTGLASVDAPSSMSGNAARTTEEFLSNVDGATLVRADDFGNIYELPNVGGVPEITLDGKAAILGELEGEYVAATGKNIKLVEVLKPSSPVRKPGGVAKLELTEQKTGKAAMVDGGAPESIYGEANVWRNTTPPTSQPGFKKLPKARQDAAIKEWNKANEAWDAWDNPKPGSKTERLKQCIGQECQVPLDLEPNASGLQRFVNAEYELVEITQGTAEAKLIRVKKYEVVTKVDGKTVNTKAVVERSEVGLPQTPDADAVAVGKQKLNANGDPVFDAQGRPVVEPLNRAEREFVMQRYIDKNVKARKNGTIPDAAEHGVTLVMDDASALAAGKLLPMYGTPFLSEGVGSAYLQRIAKFVKPKGVSTEEMYQRMLKLVQSEGGFGQHAVVLTTDTRYLGELAVSAW